MDVCILCVCVCGVLSVEVSATGWSLVQRNSIECVCVCVIDCDQVRIREKESEGRPTPVFIYKWQALLNLYETENTFLDHLIGGTEECVLSNGMMINE